jgi:hypothetical protein
VKEEVVNEPAKETLGLMARQFMKKKRLTF